MRFIGLDLGEKSLGVAVTDQSNIIVSGKGNYFYKEFDPLKIIDSIKKIVEEYHYDVSTIVLGHPLKLNGTNSPWTIKVQSFYKLLKTTFKDINVVLYDERYSTREAIEHMKKYDLKYSKMKKIKDEQSAIVILQNYLETIKK